MYLLKQYNEKFVKYDLINKFNYKLINDLPNLNCITLSFNIKKFNIKLLTSSLTSLKVITLNKGIITKSKISNISLKIRKGQPIGCKVTLNNNSRYMFLYKFLNKSVIYLKNKQTFNKIFSIKLKNILIFENLEKNYQFFRHLYGLNITIATTSNNFQEFLFLLNSFKIYKKVKAKVTQFGRV